MLCLIHHVIWVVVINTGIREKKTVHEVKFRRYYFTQKQLPSQLKKVMYQCVHNYIFYLDLLPEG
jgi:hypothetical protein